MNYTVKIGDRAYVVHIPDLNTRPVIAIVEGEAYEVWPEETAGPIPAPAPSPRPVASWQAFAPQSEASAGAQPPAPTSQVRTPASLARSSSAVLAPIPGVIVSIAVTPGDSVSPGQEVCILEAMKMKNVIRSTQDGVVARILVAPGQTVRHHDALVEFEE